MKRYITLILSVILFIFVAVAQKNERKQYTIAGVAFYNLENLFDTINSNGNYDFEYSPDGAKQWDSEKYWAKINNMAYAISQMASTFTPMGPAVIGVSEIENKSVLDDLVNADPIKKWNLQVVHHDSPDRRGIDVSLLYNPRLFKVLNVNNHTLTIDGYDEFRTRDQMCVTGLLNGKKVSIIVNHWPSRLGGQERSAYLRVAAAELSKHIADSLWTEDPNQGIIIMGDLNDDPQDESCAEVLGAKKNKDYVNTHGFYNPFWEILDKGIGTLTYKGKWNLFDQIIVSGNLVNTEDTDLHYWKAEVINEEFLKVKEGKYSGSPKRTYSSGKYINGYSDHFPTQVYFKKAKK